MNFYSSLLSVAQRQATAPCLIRPGRSTWTYADLTAAVDRMASSLLRHSVEPGDRVLVQVDKSAENVALYLATLKIGAVYVPINSGYTADEVGYFLADSEPRVFVCTPERAAGVNAAKTTVLSLDVVGVGSLTEGATDANAHTGDVVPRDDSDMSAILYTSGTTGRSKGAMLSHGNMASNTATLLGLWGWRDDDVLLHALPIFHVHGLFVALHCALASGTPMIFLDAFEVTAVNELLSEATVLMGVPTFYTRLLGLDAFGQASAANMRLFISGSAPLTEPTFDAFAARSGHRILERYGMSETLMNISNPLDGERVAGTVGFGLPDVSVRVSDDAGQELPRGEVGVIEVKGPNVFSGYWRMPEKTAEEFRGDGFFITGDMAFMDESGRVSIVGRAKDLVISGGYNVYPKEVEKLIDEIPGIQESAVIGVPHADFGEAVVAIVVPSTLR